MFRDVCINFFLTLMTEVFEKIQMWSYQSQLFFMKCAYHIALKFELLLNNFFEVMSRPIFWSLRNYAALDQLFSSPYSDRRLLAIICQYTVVKDFLLLATDPFTRMNPKYIVQIFLINDDLSFIIAIIYKKKLCMND